MNHTIISLYSELKVFKNIELAGEISSKLQMTYLVQKCIILVNFADNHYLPYYNELIQFL